MSVGQWGRSKAPRPGVEPQQTRPSRHQQKGRVDGPANDPDELARARLLRASRRSEVASFIVMDVRMRGGGQGGGGRARHPHGGGQPATPAPRLAREALSRAMERETLGYTLALGITRCASASRGITGSGTASTSIPSASW